MEDEMKTNELVNVMFFGGIAAIFNSPRKRLEKTIKNMNQQGWCVRQVIPAKLNIVFIALSLAVLLLTAFIYMPIGGYMVIFEKIVD
jgi:hypothetical protein